MRTLIDHRPRCIGKLWASLVRPSVLMSAAVNDYPRCIFTTQVSVLRVAVVSRFPSTVSVFLLPFFFFVLNYSIIDQRSRVQRRSADETALHLFDRARKRGSFQIQRRDTDTFGKFFQTSRERWRDSANAICTESSSKM